MKNLHLAIKIQNWNQMAHQIQYYLLAMLLILNLNRRKSYILESVNDLFFYFNLWTITYIII